MLILAATNLPWELDTALRRRFEKRIYVPVPGKEERPRLIGKMLENTEHSLSKDDIEAISRELEGFSGADIEILVREAAFEPLRIGIRATHFKRTKGRVIPCSPSDKAGVRMSLGDVSPDELALSAVELEHFLMGMSICRPSLSEEELKKYVNWTKDFGSD
jgi:vacuolar protein-sorting-associated protein 4